MAIVWTDDQEGSLWAFTGYLFVRMDTPEEETTVLEAWELVLAEHVPAKIKNLLRRGYDQDPSLVYSKPQRYGENSISFYVEEAKKDGGNSVCDVETATARPQENQS